MVRLTVHFAGHVQGVGFRYTTAGVARGHDVTGYVQNLPDGRVLLVAEGQREAVRAFVADVRETMADHIRDASIDEAAASGEFRGFTIRR